MPLYHFNVRDGQDFPDEDGTELVDIASARKEAVALAGRLLADNAEGFWNGTDWHINVTDDTGRLLFTLNFAATIAPTAIEAALAQQQRSLEEEAARFKRKAGADPLHSPTRQPTH